MGDFKFATEEEQIDKAGAIIVGTVDRVYGRDVINDPTVDLRNVKYLKGCGSDYVTIEGFSNSAMCGQSPPKVGTRIVLFVCLNNDKLLESFSESEQMPRRDRRKARRELRNNDLWFLNNFKILLPTYEAERDLLIRIRKRVAKEYGCTGCCRSLTKCEGFRPPFNFEEILND